MSVTASFADAIRLVASMTWETWWALVLGFTLSGVVEVFVSEQRMTEVLGDDGWREVALGSAFGAASSSCSYSAVGTSKSLFKKGASGVASLGAFLFASTDLVIELGLVMWVLLGWEFVVGEYLGGVIAICVLALIFRNVVPQSWFDAAREHLHDVEETNCDACGMEADPTDEETIAAETTGGTKYFCCGGCRRAYESQHGETSSTGEVAWADKLLTVDGWDAACKKTVKDWEMLWEDIALGFVLAGLIGAFVPEAWWAALFGVETGLQSVVFDTVIAVVIGVVTFMCSVGNVPFALVLWTNGLPFGSVLAFIYADLIIPPLVRTYRRYYGIRMAAVLFGSLFVAAVVAGVAAHYLLGGLGIVPPRTEVGGTLSGGYTTTLNLVLTPVFLAQVYVTYGPERMEAAIRELPQAAWRGCETVLDATDLLVQTAAAFLADLGDAGRTLGTGVRSVGAGIVTIGGAFRMVLGAVRAACSKLYTEGRNLR
ncbi:permease [Halococcus saccharolyticus]|uniref:Putative metal ion permease n=1 Tax=Halococcus saccharolyticus DSM 5350 TaxID=1227455 RepID=M0MTR2_9EURY|nr:permease [Halococcus saccharolyticus]EMA47860.1 putative metal ion permease [Halococcus saccharolyticus DSM 5350]